MIALWEPDSDHRTVVARQLARLGYAVRAFQSVEEFALVLDSDVSFGLLMVAAEDRSTLSGIAAISRALRIPVLLLVKENRWPQAIDDYDFFCVGALGMSTLGDSGWDRELEWRVKSLRRHASSTLEKEASRSDVVWGPYRFCFYPERTVFIGDVKTHLQPRQFDVAYQLFSSLGDVVPRSLLLRAFWMQSDGGDTSKSLDVCVARVRKNLLLSASNGYSLHAVYGRGYRLVRESLAGSLRA